MGDSEFPSLKAVKLLKLLKRLGYRVQPGTRKGSHFGSCVMEDRGSGRPFHNKVTVPPRSVKAVLVDQAGLTVEEAKEVLNID